MFVRVRPNQPGSDLGAINRLGQNAQMAPEHRHVEACEVKQLQHLRIGQQALEVGRGIGPALELNRVADAVAGGKLRQAQPVADRVETQGLAVDGDDGAEVQPVGQIVLVEFGFQAGLSISACAAEPKPLRLSPQRDQRGAVLRFDLRAHFAEMDG